MKLKQRTIYYQDELHDEFAGDHIKAKHIGQDCRIFQQVTIGFNGMEQPVLEDRVEVSAGAIVIGNVCLHSDCVVGAGAVVVNDVNENTVVVGVPAKTIRFNRE